MQSSSRHESHSIISVFVLFFFLFSPIFSSNAFREENGTFVIGNKSKKMCGKIKRPYVKSIKSACGDITDCVLFHLQPAFDLPELKREMSSCQPKFPKGHANEGKHSEIKQLWNAKGESCPNGTIPIRRTCARNILSSKLQKNNRRQGTSDPEKHEHAIGYVEEGYFLGAKASLNTWEPYVASDDFSLSQIWLLSEEDATHPVESIEFGWHVYPHLYEDSLPRLFSYWTPDGYRSGCYNLLCSGFVQTSQKISLGAIIDPVTTYTGSQYDFDILIWKDVETTNWWLAVGTELIGYWPKSLFRELRDNASTIEYGGEVGSLSSGNKHTTTQMGSGHFPDEGFRRTAYVKKMQVIDQDNHVRPVSDLITATQNPNCYDVKKYYADDDAWGNYIYFGGPGYNSKCH